MHLLILMLTVHSGKADTLPPPPVPTSAPTPGGEPRQAPSNVLYLPAQVNGSVSLLEYTISGRLFDGDGNVLPNFPSELAEVYTWPNGEKFWVLDIAFGPHCYTDADGYFSMTFLPLSDEYLPMWGYCDVTKCENMWVYYRTVKLTYNGGSTDIGDVMLRPPLLRKDGYEGSLSGQ
jgi:hypothetical protein